MERSKHDLVDKMAYLFVRVVRARGLPAGAHPHVRVAAGGIHASTREARRGAFFEWDQTFAFVRDPDTDSPGPTLEVSVWDLPPDADVSVADDRHFLGGLCFDTAELHARDLPDGPLATQWYRLEGGRGTTVPGWWARGCSRRSAMSRRRWRGCMRSCRGATR